MIVVVWNVIGVTAISHSTNDFNRAGRGRAYSVLGVTESSIRIDELASAAISVGLVYSLNDDCQQCVEIPAGHKDGFHKRYLPPAIAPMCCAGHNPLRPPHSTCRHESDIGH